jgi:SAM-dependent methyltransferase
MMQKKVWENEYQNHRLVTGSQEPQSSVKEFLRWLRREQNMPLENIRVLDLGCGNGKNSNYIAELDFGNNVVGVDISETALKQARVRAHELEEQEKIGANQVTFENRSIGEVFPFADHSFDLALDVTSSNSLSEKERELFIKETHRVLKPGGYFFIRNLCKDGDKNAAALIVSNPGPEKDTYIMPEIGLTERTFSRADFIAAYSPKFKILKMDKETHYTKFGGRSYKRNFWVAYGQKSL